MDLTITDNLEEKITTDNIGDDETFNNILEELRKLNLLEASELKRSVDSVVTKYEHCKQDIDANMANTTIDEATRNITSTNILQMYSIPDSVEDFLSSYDEVKSRIDQMASVLLEIIDRDKEKLSSTKFMTEQLLTIVEKNLSRTSERGPKYVKLMEVRNSLVMRKEDPVRLLYLVRQQFEYYLFRRWKALRKQLRHDEKDLSHNCRTSAVAAICSVFSNDTARRFIDSLTEILEEDGALERMHIDFYPAVDLFLNFIANKLYYKKQEATKVIVLNILDLASGVYDIDDVDQYRTMLIASVVLPIYDLFANKNIDLSYWKGIKKTTWGLHAPKMKEVPATDSMRELASKTFKEMVETGKIDADTVQADEIVEETPTEE